MKRPAPGGRLKSLAELRSVKIVTSRPASARSASAGPPAVSRSAEAGEFREAVRDVKPLGGTRTAPALPGARPHAVQRERDNRAVLDESLADRIGVETLLDTDAALSYRSHGISADTLRKLRRGFWVVQAELDLHGHRVAEAHEALNAFLRDAMLCGRRCVRIVHGKGNGSRDGVPVLKGKVRSWLARRNEVIAYCQAQAADGGAGALLVLLRP